MSTIDMPDYRAMGVVPKNANPVLFTDVLRATVERETGYRPNGRDMIYVLREDRREDYFAVIAYGNGIIMGKYSGTGIRQGTLLAFQDALDTEQANDLVARLEQDQV